MVDSKILVIPSLLAADFARLGDQVQAAEQGGADRLHVDVMDGHFVPNVALGPETVRGVRPCTRLPLETHLMVDEPDRLIERFLEAGSDRFYVHQEGNPNLHRTVQRVKELGKPCGVAINPATPALLLEEILPDIDAVLVMTVNPGFGGQAFLPNTLAKIRQIRQMIDQKHPGCELAVDGGIDCETVPRVVSAGARVLIAGTAVFRGEGGAAQAIGRLRAAARSASPRGES